MNSLRVRGRIRRAVPASSGSAALIDRDEALWQARSDLEKMRTLATNWEAEVASVHGENRGLRSSLEGAQAQ
jgi:hypothetical protein